MGLLALLPPDSYPVAGEELAIAGSESAGGAVPPVLCGGVHGWRPGWQGYPQGAVGTGGEPVPAL